MQPFIFSRLNSNKRKRRLSLSNEQNVDNDPKKEEEDNVPRCPSLKKPKLDQSSICNGQDLIGMESIHTDNCAAAIPYLPTVPDCRKTVRRITTLMQTEDVSIGDFVQLSNSFHRDRLRGVVRFIGEVHALRYSYDGIFGHNYLGIELSVAEGDTDGTIENEYYFHTQPKHGVFVKRDKIDKIITLNWSVPRLTIDDVIHMQQFACNGKIRYIGQRYGDDESRPEPDCIDYGIELSQPRGDNNGCINDVIYFASCRPKCGVFLSNRYLSDLIVLRKSHLLLSGFLRRYRAFVDVIPNDILCAMSQFFRFIRVEFHKRIMVTINRENTGPSRGACGVYNVFDMDDEMIGPGIYALDLMSVNTSGAFESLDSDRVSEIISQNLAIQNDTDGTDDDHDEDEDFDPVQLLQDIAEQYGVTASEFNGQLRKKISHFSLKTLHFIQR